MLENITFNGFMAGFFIGGFIFAIVLYYVERWLER